MPPPQTRLGAETVRVAAAAIAPVELARGLAAIEASPSQTVKPLSQHELKPARDLAVVQLSQHRREFARLHVIL